MREIKFRAYGALGDDAKKEMVYDRQDTIYVECVGFDGREYFEVMQYTGLKDRNGKEIYEGDICLNSDGSGPFVVSWIRGGWHKKGRGYEVSLEDYYISDEMLEIIGNKYENPELLK